MAPPAPATSSPVPRGPLRKLVERGRGGPVVLVVAVLASVLVASIGTGYTSTKADLDDAKTNVAKGVTVAQINAESQRKEAEAEARDLAPGKQQLEVVTLGDGQVATVNRDTDEVIFFVDPGLQNPTTTRPSDSDATRRPAADQLAVVPGKDAAAYVVDPAEDVVELVDKKGKVVASKYVNGLTNEVIPDGTEGIWVVAADGGVAHVTGDKVTMAASRSVQHLTIADGLPIAITGDGTAIDLTSATQRTVADEKLPHGRAVLVGSPSGPGRYLVLLDRKASRLIVVDPRTRSVVGRFTDLPDSKTHLGAPVVLDDRIYVPDFKAHELIVFDLSAGKQIDRLPVPGTTGTFSLEVAEHRVWANDQFDQRALVVDREGGRVLVDKGPGDDVTDSSPPDTPNAPVSSAPETQPTPHTQNPPATTESTPAPPVKELPLVTVPTIAPGTPQQQACDSIVAAKLQCLPVRIGAGGALGTVRDTDPPGGYELPENDVVRVRVYGAVVVPNLVGLSVDRACELVESGQSSGETGPALTCAEQTAPDAAADFAGLNKVTAQDPAAGTEVSAAATVTARYVDHTVMPDLKNRDGATECTAIVAATGNAVSCTIVEGTNAVDASQAGTVESQIPPPGGVVRTGTNVVLTIYRSPVPQVPAVPAGTPIDQACQLVESYNYGCDRRADDLARHANTVTRQEPPPGTPQAGGVVVLHFAPVEPEPIYKWTPKNGDRDLVFLIRMGPRAPGNDYYMKVEPPIGYAYTPDTTQPGTGNSLINDFYCTAGPVQCGGYERNHYMSRDAAPKAGFSGPIQAARFIDIPATGCPPDMKLLNRYFRHPGDRMDYDIATSPPWEPAFTEALGCVWQ